MRQNCAWFLRRSAYRGSRVKGAVFRLPHNTTPNRTSPPPAEHCSLALLREDLHAPQINCRITLIFKETAEPCLSYHIGSYRLNTLIMNLGLSLYEDNYAWQFGSFHVFTCMHNKYPPLTRLLAT